MSGRNADATRGDPVRGLRVLMCGPALGYSNAGDRLLPKTLGEVLRDRFPGTEVTYLSVEVDPRVKRESPWLAVVNPKRRPWRAAWLAWRADAFVIAGAIAFHDHRLTMLKQAGLALICRLGGGRVVVNAVSVQPMRDGFCRAMTRWTHRLAHWFTVRDDGAAAQGRAAGIKSPLRRSCDPGIICRAAPDERVDAILRAEGVALDRPIVAIAPHHFVNRGRYHDPAYAHFGIEYSEYSDEQIDAYHDALARIADALAEQATVVFVSMCTAVPPGDDRAAGRRVRERMRQAEAAHVLEGEYDVEELAGLLGRARLLVASRLHAFAMGVGRGTPSLAIEFHPKVRGLAEELGMEEDVYPMDGLDAASVIERARALLADHAAQQARVREAVAAAAERAAHDFVEGVTGRRPARGAS